MISFKPNLARKVMAGTKTMTRRRLRDNTRSPWFEDKCGFVVGDVTAVCPGRGEHAIGQIEITSVEKQMLCRITDDEAKREGFLNRHAFFTWWRAQYGGLDPFEYVWVIGFRVDVPADREVVIANG